MSKLNFVDVSHHNGEIPWNRFRDNGIKGGIVKLVDGYWMPPTYKSHIDPQFFRNWQALDTFDLRGAYIYLRFVANRSGGMTPAMQVKLAVNTIGDHKDTDILAVDVEQPSNQIAHISKLARVHMLEDALKEAEKYWDKTYIFIYTAAWWWNEQMPLPSTYIKSFPLWVAYYTSLNLRKYMLPKGWAKEDVIAHQYSASKKIEGITIDHNEFLWDWDEYLQLLPEIIPTPIPPEPLPNPEPIPVPEPEPIPLPPTPAPEPQPDGCLPALVKLVSQRKQKDE